MINFRVRDLAAIVAQLRDSGIKFDNYPVQPNGLFARLSDPEGHRIELWEPRPVGRS
jgi:glyoxylase I family protein